MRKIFTLLLFVFCVGGCSKEPIEMPDGPIQICDGQLPITFSETADDRVLDCVMPGTWHATLVGGEQWCYITPQSGDAGAAHIAISVDSNGAGHDRSAVLEIRSGGASCQIPIMQVSAEQLSCSIQRLSIKSEGEEVEVIINANVRVRQSFDVQFERWLTLVGESIPEQIQGMTEQRFHYHVGANMLQELRKATIVFTGNNKEASVDLSQVSSNSPLSDDESYESTDYVVDGKCVTLQRAFEGRGLDVVVMGDAFTDRQIADGTYDKWVAQAVKALFAKEPYASFGKLFNIYMVYAVSPHASYTTEGARRALGTYFGEGLKIDGDDSKCKSYAMKVPGMTAERLENTLVMVLLNSRRYGGRCKLHFPSQRNDYGCGTAISYMALGSDYEMFAGLVQHEAGGHGFAKLADEYFFDESGDIPEAEVHNANRQEEYGWLKNIDFHSTLSTVKWRGLMADSRYAGKVGIFEGGFTWQNGVYRPTEDGLMRTNLGEYNAPSRQAIYYRIHKMAYGPEWSYDHSKFLAYDADNRFRPGSAPSSRAADSPFEPLPPPIVCNHLL